ncbi:hypothetical protein QT327_16740 [Olivibacter sp. 47]|jgi:hypothetical protein|nr:hypothetical protein [Olivibacter sp. 47]
MGFLCPNQFNNTLIYQYNELCLFAATDEQALLRHKNEPAAKAVLILSDNIASRKGGNVK